MEPLPNPGWSDFGVYRSLKESGLRREALERLDIFISSMLERSFADRKEFACWVLSTVEDMQFLPQPLRVRIIEPLLREWIARDSRDPTPHLLLGGLADLWEAHRLDPSHIEVKWQLITKVLKVIDFEMHELPWGFLGDGAGDSYAMLLRLRHFLSEIPKSRAADDVDYQIDGRMEVLSNYIAYERDPIRSQDEPFKSWCERLGRRGRW